MLEILLAGAIIVIVKFFFKPQVFEDFRREWAIVVLVCSLYTIGHVYLWVHMYRGVQCRMLHRGGLYIW